MIMELKEEIRKVNATGLIEVVDFNEDMHSKNMQEFMV